MSGSRAIPFGRPWITEQDRAAVMEVLNGPILTHGPRCKEFEDEFGRFMGGEVHCITVSSCMAALHLAYLQMGIGPGDEVLVPAETHAATAHAVEAVGARPVFVDCDEQTGNIDPSRIEAAITADTKALSLVHFLGIPCRMDRIMSIAERHGLRVVEDCALAVGSRFQGKHVGLFGEAGCYSFYPVKHITTGEGGMFVTTDDSVAERVSKLRAFGVDRKHNERSIPGWYDVPSLGLNYRMSEMQAALGRQQMLRAEEMLERRESNFTRLKGSISHLPSISVIDTDDDDCANSHYCLSIVLRGDLRERRNAVVASLKEAGIGTSIYYPNPVPRLSYYAEKYGFQPGEFGGAETISDFSIALPVGPHVVSDDIDYMAERLEVALEGVAQ